MRMTRRPTLEGMELWPQEPDRGGGRDRRHASARAAAAPGCGAGGSTWSSSPTWSSRSSLRRHGRRARDRGGPSPQLDRHGQLLLVSFVLCAPLVLRTRFPLTAWTASAVAMLWATRSSRRIRSSSAVVPPGRGDRLRACACTRSRSAASHGWWSARAWSPWSAPPSSTRRPCAAAIFVAAVRGLRRRHRPLPARQPRAARRSAERRHEGERALLEERQRIARELHDVVAHHMSVIAIQAEAAPYKVADPPKELVESFAEIRASALSGLSELRRVLGVLRSDQPDTAPQPGLDDLDGLLESARSGGVTVTVGVSGTPRPAPGGRGPVRLPDRAGGAEQRDAARAGVGGPGEAVLRRGRPGHRGPQRRLPRPATQVAGAQHNGAGLGRGGGHGIIGMRERAAMLGGHLQAGPTRDGEFLVTAALPLGDGEPEDAR